MELSSVIVLAGVFLLGSYFSVITDWSEVSAQLRDSGHFSPDWGVLRRSRCV